MRRDGGDRDRDRGERRDFGGRDNRDRRDDRGGPRRDDRGGDRGGDRDNIWRRAAPRGGDEGGNWRNAPRQQDQAAKPKDDRREERPKEGKFKTR